MADTPLVAFWRALNAALAERGIAEATFGEVRDFYDSGYRTADHARDVARTWAPDTVEPG